MRNIRIIVAVLSTLFFLFTQHNETLAVSGLEFKVSCDKEKYNINEPIYVTFEIANKSDRPYFVNKRFYINSKESKPGDGEVWLSVVSPSGKEPLFKSSYKTGLPKTDYFVLLEPGEAVGSEHKRNLRSYFDLEEPGVYTITATYQNVYGEEIGIDAFKERLRSESVRIEIVEQGP